MTNGEMHIAGWVLRLSGFIVRFLLPPTTAFAPTGSWRSFDCAPQSLRSAQDDGISFTTRTAPPILHSSFPTPARLLFPAAAR
jgi:hypothetical protein